MKKFTFIVLVLLAFGWHSQAQIVTDASAWPNAAWTLSGTYDAGSLLGDPTGTDANWSYDDDAAGSGSTDIIILESPVIDLTTAPAGGENLISITLDYNYNLGDVFNLEYWDFDASTWVLWTAIADNSFTTSNWCGAVTTTTTADLDVAAFTATQLANFQYRYNYDASSVFGWGYCITSSTLNSAAPITCFVPTALTIDSFNASSATISWTENNGASDWEIVVQADGTGTPGGAGTAITANPHFELGLTGSTAYEVYVRTICGVGDESTWAGPVDFTTLPSAPPACPASFTATPDVACGNFNTAISWDAVIADGYNVTVGTTMGGNDIMDNVDVGNLTSASVPNQVAGTTYYYTIAPYNVAGTQTGCTEQTYTTFATGCLCQSVPTSVDNDGITNVRLDVTDFASPAAPNNLFIDHSGTAIDLAQGVLANCDITYETGFDYDVHIWIDFNDDLTLDPSEIVFSGLAPATNPNTFNADFTVPGAAALGTHKMRIGTADSGQATADPCYSGSFGTTIDFDVNIIAVSCTPAVINSSTVVENCAAGTFTVDVDVASVGTATFIVGTAPVPIVAGSNILGPFPNDTPQDLTVIDVTNSACNFVIGTFQNAICPPTPPSGVTCTSGSSSILFTEEFDAVGAWTGDTTTTDTGGDWEFAGSAGSTGTGPSAAFSGANYMNFEGTGGNNVTASTVSPTINLTDAVDGAELAFYMHAFGAAIGTLDVGVGTSAAGPFTSEFTWTGQFQTSETDPWVPVGVDLSAYMGSVIYIEFLYTAGNDFTSDIAIDLMTVEACGDFCLDPSGLAAANITDSGADFTWTAGGTETDWEIAVQAAGTGTPAGAGTAVATTPAYTASGLSSGTEYEAYVRADCGGSFSLWVGPINFTTDPGCGDTVYDTGGASGDYSNNENYTITYSPDVPGNVVTLNFTSVALENCCDTLTIYDGVDTAAPVLDADLEAPALFTATGASGALTIEFVSDTSVTGAGWEALWTCTPPPTCGAVSGIAVSNVTGTSADISWTDAEGETNWEIAVQTAGTGTPGTPDNSGTDTTSNPYSATGLTDTTAYEVYVRADCAGDGSNLGSWVGPVNFTTLPQAPAGVTCVTGSAAYIYSEEFEAVGGWTGNINIGNGGWEIPGDATSPDTGPSSAFSGAAGSYMNYEASGNATATASAVSPAIDLTAAVDDAELSFYMHAYGSAMGTLNVGVGTSAAGPFTTAFTWSGDLQTSAADAWVPIGVDLSAYLGQTIYVEFSHTGSGTSFEGDMSIDFIRVEACGNFCVDPSSVAVSNINGSEADIAWVANGSETAWEYAIQLQGTGTPAGAGTATATNPVTATGLTASTAYEVYVRADCGGAVFSGWAGPVNFSTTVACPDVTAITLDNFGDTTADISWTAGGGVLEAGWEIVVQADGTGAPAGAGTAATNPYSATGLTPETAYEVYVRADCAGDGFSGWAGPLDFTTSCASTVPDYVADMANNVPDSCWDEATEGEVAAGPSNLGGSDWDQGNTYAVGASNAINLFFNNDREWLLSPSFDLSADGYELVVNVAVSNWNDGFTADNMGSDDEVQLLMSTDGGVSWSNLTTWNAGNQPALGGTEYTEDLTGTTGTDVRFAIFASDGTVDDLEDYDFHVGRFEVRTPPSCSDVSAVNVANVGTTTADVAWTSGDPGDTLWEVAIQAAGTGEPAAADGSGTDTGSNPYNATGLTSNTAYEVYVRTDCSGDFGAWVGPVNFTTEAACGDTVYDTGGAAANYSNSESYTITYLPDAPGNVVTLDFTSVALENCCDTLSIYDGLDTAAPVLNADLEAPDTFTATSASGAITIEFNSDTSVTGAGWEANYTCAAPPTCTDVSAIAVSGITTTTADIAWTNAGSETAWEVAIQAPGTGVPAAADGSGADSASNPYNATGLTEATNYEVYVRAECTAGVDFGGWIGPVAFATSCNTFSLPLVEGFESGVPPVCWTSFRGTNGEGTGFDWTTSPLNNSGAASAFVRYENSGALNEDWLVTPAMDFTGATNAELVFYAAQQFTGAFGSNYTIRVSTTDTAHASFTTVETYTEADLPIVGTDGFSQFTVDLSAYSGNTTVYVAFVMDNDDGDNFFVDDVLIWDNAPGTYTYTNGVWSPFTPANDLDDIIVAAGNLPIDADFTCNTMTVNPGAAVTVDAGNTLTATNGLFLESSSTSYSSLIRNGSIVGAIEYSRHVNVNGSGSTGSNDLVSAPLTGQQFDNFAVANPNIFSNGAGTLYLFGPFNKGLGYYVTWANTETSTLDPGVGYRAASTDNGNFNFVGTDNNSDVVMDIQNSGPNNAEWNLIGNPYPSYLNVQDFLLHDVGGVVNIQLFDAPTAAIYGYDGSALNGWTIYNLATTGASTVIAPGQGFFVSADATNAGLYDLEFTPAMRSVGTSDDFIVGRNAQLTYLTLNLSSNNNGYNTDFYFNTNASEGFDLGYDAAVWGESAPAFSIYSKLVQGDAGEAFALQALKDTDLANVTIPLGVNANQGEQITFSIHESTLPANVKVYLDDTVKNTTTLLNDADYTLTPSADLSGTGRFFLRYEEDALSTIDNSLDQLDIYSLKDSDELVVSGQLEDNATLDLFDIQGRKVLTTELDSALLQNRINVSNINAGIYLVTVQSDSQETTKKVIIE